MFIYNIVINSYKQLTNYSRKNSYQLGKYQLGNRIVTNLGSTVGYWTGGTQSPKRLLKEVTTSIVLITI